ncbi:type I-E CRISPR-associated protein Cse2/CasB [Paracoccus sp. (in: a-proteobacteria)]|uniref:type I-E CRISPR-associated protein Cse2/CasB n=1 Tax=Paracoccus sp. TaxID=267 RepID=UPI00321F7B8B
MSEPANEVGSRACAIAAALAAAGAGERAAARRMGSEGSALFWRMVARHKISRRDEESWRRITQLLALLTPSSATETRHQAGHRFGAVLADGGAENARLEQPALSEQRLARLLAARGPARLDAIERAVRALARQQPRIDAPSLAWAVLREDGRDIARDYYNRLDRRTEQNPEDADA